MSGARLDDRMKEYEHISRIYLTRRLPMIIRIDGKAFHRFTAGFRRPFDHLLMQSMQDTARHLCENIEGCKLAYTQSDEISLLITDYDTIGTQPWFGKNLQKVVSVSASMATMAFNRSFLKRVQSCTEDQDPIAEAYKAVAGLAMFDSRAFILPHEEVCNYFIYRQQDAVRNSIQMLGQAHFSHKALHKKNCAAIQDMLMEKYSVNWNDLPVVCQRGSCVVRREAEENGVVRHAWEVDTDIPLFVQDRNYVDKHVFVLGSQDN